ncbi:unnamed protein product [Sphenostylis stenocarpa]|uniref:Transglutaminase-like domain-containing protein n=1 Tax=Sphenostylis stenocarpa TaxID=92480 RepID=A0AA86SQI0_9FABA|nr:unnamed protein product [Sphenostylis stenocarpa]
MVARRFQVVHDDSDFDIHYDTDDGFEIFGAEQDTPVTSDSDLFAISDKLRLVSVNDSDFLPEPEPNNSDLLKSDEELARLLQAEEEALLLQQYVSSENPREFDSRVRSYISQVRMYEDATRQEAARKSVPVEELEEKALVSLAKEGNFKPSKIEQDHAFMLQLLFWFKKSFRWVNSPSCHDCGKETVGQGMTAALPSETLYGASRLVETREGRCGEWANCFTLYCRAFGYESRLTTFGQSASLNSWAAIAKDGVYDVTKRYTRKWHEVLSRRTMLTEASASSVLYNITNEIRRGFASELLSIIQARDMEEKEELERSFHVDDDESLSLPGRRSGNEEWRKSRLEIGSSDLSSSACPVRLCIDEHVTKIYNSFRVVLYQFVGEELTKSEAVEVLRITKGIILDLLTSPYKTRRTFIDSVLNEPKFQKMLPSFDDLLGALSLEKKMNTDESVEIGLLGDPIVTSLALPVALDALDDMIYNLNNCENYGKDMFQLPILKLNRIHSGSAIASSEELPFGIITSAFDGTRGSKWEEPNGARGCWIVYRTFGYKMFELEAYELMSANDAPERDPMDWILEGSSDEGISWQVLNKQTSQFFEDRFQRRTYKISASFPCNVFR